MSPAQNRLTPDDNLFVAMEQVLDLPVVNQCVWLLGPGVDREDVAEIARRLTRGRLSRLVVRTPPPTRDRWVFTPDAGEFAYEPTPIDAEEVGEWARRALANGRIDSVRGPAWRLTAVPTTEGRTAVSLVSAHVVGDGAAVVAGVAEAARDAHERGMVTTPPSLVDAVVDGGSALGAAARSVFSLLWNRASEPSSRSAPDRAPADALVAAAEPAPLVTVIVDAAEVDAAATRCRGTANTLFAAVVLGVLVASGRVGEDDEVPITVPMAVRTGPDLRANATTAVTVPARVTPDRYVDIAPLRAASKAAFRGVGGGPDDVASLATLAQVLPDGVVRRLASGARTPLCLASNLGTLPAEFAGLGGEPGPVAMRSTTVGVTADRLVQAGGGVSAWAARSAGAITLSFASLDPVHIPDAASLRALVCDELARFGLVGRPWL